jgi:phosphopantothenoylcysteine decarboxylase
MIERMRVVGVRVWRHKKQLTVLGSDQRALRFEGHSADLAEAVLELLSVACTREQLFSHLEAAAGQTIPTPGPVDDLLRSLSSIGVLRTVTNFTSQRARSERNVVLAVSGAVAAAHAPMMLSALLQEGYNVRVALTENALRFTTREALEAISHGTVVTSHWQRDDRTHAYHIELAEWAELVLVYPATATTLARMAHGECSDVVCATAIAARCPVVVAPSMNASMYHSPSVQRNLETLRDDGFYMVLPTAGVEVALAPEQRVAMYGPAPLPDDIVAIVRTVLQTNSGVQLPHDARSWDDLYRWNKPEALPWNNAVLEATFAAMFQCLVTSSTRCLDVGTGTGTLALALASLGGRVTATDIAPAAIDLARKRPGATSIQWLLDDVCESKLEGPYDLIVDRGCLHVLPRERHALWVHTLRRLSVAGTMVLVMVHDPSEHLRAATQGYNADTLRALFSPWCDEIRATPVRMEGSSGVSRASWLVSARVTGLTG